MSLRPLYVMSETLDLRGGDYQLLGVAEALRRPYPPYRDVGILLTKLRRHASIARGELPEKRVSDANDLAVPKHDRRQLVVGDLVVLRS